MGLVIEFFGVVEGVAVDARNAFTLVAVNQNVIVTPSLPFSGARHFVTFGYDYEGDELAEGANIEVDFQVTSPSGATVAGQHNIATTPKKAPDSPKVPGNGMSLILSLNLFLAEYGEYLARLTLKLHSREVHAERRFWVVAPGLGVAE
jgi:hypothetical protein